MDPKPGLLSGTFTGSTTDFRVGLEMLKLLQADSLYGESGWFQQHHREFRRQVTMLAERRPKWFPGDRRSIVGGIGGMMRMTPFGGEKEKITRAAKAIFEEGAIVFWCGHGPFHLRMLPPLLIMKQDDWPKVFEVIEKGLEQVAH